MQTELQAVHVLHGDQRDPRPHLKAKLLGQLVPVPVAHTLSGTRM